MEPALPLPAEAVGCIMAGPVCIGCGCGIGCGGGGGGCLRRGGAGCAGLAHVIADVMGSDVTLVSSAIETALVARDELQAAGLLREPGGEPAEHRFLSSGDISWFADLGGRLLGPELRDAAQWHHD